MSFSKSVRIWSRKVHRRMGVGCLLLFLILSVTGFIQNHPETFQLDNNFLSYRMSKLFYGAEFPTTKSYLVGEEWLTQMNEELYLNGTLAAPCGGRFSGAVFTGRLYGAACGDSLVVLSSIGELIETIPSTDTPLNSIAYVTLCEGDICISGEGLTYRLNLNSTQKWEQTGTYSIFHIVKSEPGDIYRGMVEELMRDKFSWQQLVRDIHLGNFGSGWGIIIMDLVWYFLFMMSCTGLYLWITQAFRKRAD